MLTTVAADWDSSPTATSATTLLIPHHDNSLTKQSVAYSDVQLQMYKATASSSEGILSILWSAVTVTKRAELLQLIWWGAFMRWKLKDAQQIQQVGIFAKSLIQQLCAMPPTKNYNFADAGDALCAVSKRWMRVRCLFESEQDDMFWLHAASSAELHMLSDIKLKTLASQEAQTVWRNIPDRYALWRRLLECKSGDAIARETKGQFTLYAAKRVRQPLCVDAHVLLSLCAFAVLRVAMTSPQLQLNNEEQQAQESMETEQRLPAASSKTAAAAELLQQWHCATREVLFNCEAPCWRKLHSNTETEAETAKSLSIAMVATNQWKFYADSVKVRSNTQTAPRSDIIIWSTAHLVSSILCCLLLFAG
jgi:hypothetical protein